MRNNTNFQLLPDKNFHKKLSIKTVRKKNKSFSILMLQQGCKISPKITPVHGFVKYRIRIQYMVLLEMVKMTSKRLIFNFI